MDDEWILLLIELLFFLESLEIRLLDSPYAFLINLKPLSCIAC